MDLTIAYSIGITCFLFFYLASLLGEELNPTKIFLLITGFMMLAIIPASFVIPDISAIFYKIFLSVYVGAFLFFGINLLSIFLNSLVGKPTKQKK
jgi:hypothetical protein